MSRVIPLMLVMAVVPPLVACSRATVPPSTASSSDADELSGDIGEFPKELTNSIGMKLVLIPKGKFLMGSPDTETDRNVNELLHEVTISRDYYLGAYEVTQGQYEKVMGTNPSFFKKGWFRGDRSNHPVEQVSWEEAVEFCRRLSLLPEEKAAGRVYRLPTEAEWEYACRAGSKTSYSFGDSDKQLDNFAWYNKNSDSKTHAVGQKKPNAWGLYDMHGNVLEWCRDYYGSYDINQSLDPVGPTKGSFRVYRGGEWFSYAAECRSADRYGNIPSHRWGFLGFRLALSPTESESAIQNESKDQ